MNTWRGAGADDGAWGSGGEGRAESDGHRFRGVAAAGKPVWDRVLRVAESMGWRDVSPGGEEDVERPRPSLPPLLFLSSALWLSTAAGIDLLFGASDALKPLVLGVGLCAAVAGMLGVGLRRVAAGCALIGLGIGCLLALSHACTMESQMAALQEAGGTQVVELVRDARANEFGSTALARAENGALVRVSFSGDERMLVGQTLSFDATWKPPGDAMAQDSWRDGIVATARVKSMQVGGYQGILAPLRMVREAALDALEQAAARLSALVGSSCEEAALFLRAVLLGSTSGLYASGFYQAVKVDGLAHLVAVSGAHLVIVCGMLLALMRRLPLARSAIIPLQVCLIGGYLLLTGAPISAIRAAIMASLALVAFFARRRPYSLGALSACMAFMIALNPATAFSTSFLLSAASTLGIVLFSGLVDDWLRAPFRLGRNAITDSVSLTLAATLITLPFTASQFGQVSLIAPFANVVAAPVFGFVCIGGMAALLVCLVVPFAGQFLLIAVMGVGQLFCLVLEGISRVPGACMPVSLDAGAALVLAFAVPALLWIAWPRPAKAGYATLAAACLGVMAFSLIWPYAVGDELVMLDVGQGDAIVVRSAGHAVLVDTGTNDLDLLEGLGAHGIHSLDAVVISHPDDDHCGSLEALRGVVGVGTVVVADDLLASDGANCTGLRIAASSVLDGASPTGVRTGDVLRCGNISLTVVGPDGFVDDGGNADSVVLLLEADDDADGAVDHTALLCGDAEREQLEAYIRKGRFGRVEVYKVGHHGSRAAVDGTLAQTLSPAVSLVSVGAGNRYGHPTPEALSALENAGSAIFRTDMQGDITCHFTPDRMQVTTER